MIQSQGLTMNWEIAGLWLVKIDQVLESAKEQFPHNCKASIFSAQKNDGGPYGSMNNATHYGIKVEIPEGTDERFVQGIEDVLVHVCGEG